jgi:hypothetical protein
MLNANVHAAMEYAYRMEGVKNFTVVGDMFTSGVQHSAARTKNIMKRAQGFLDRRNAGHTLSVVRCTGGEVMHFIQ